MYVKHSMNRLEIKGSDGEKRKEGSYCGYHAGIIPLMGSRRGCFIEFFNTNSENPYFRIYFCTLSDSNKQTTQTSHLKEQVCSSRITFLFHNNDDKVHTGKAKCV